jgi:hypothetical protein
MVDVMLVGASYGIFLAMDKMGKSKGGNAQWWQDPQYSLCGRRAWLIYFYYIKRLFILKTVFLIG